MLTDSITDTPNVSIPLVIKPGDRVRHEYHGDGTVIAVRVTPLNFASVLLDKRPDVAYNMGQNPTVLWPHELTVIEKEAKEC